MRAAHCERSFERRVRSDAPYLPVLDVSRFPRVLREPPAALGVSALDDSSIGIAVKPWVSVIDFGVVPGELYQQIVERFRTSGIDMPFPQREIRIVKDSSDWGTLTRKRIGFETLPVST